MTGGGNSLCRSASDAVQSVRMHPSCLTLLVWGVLAHFETDTRQSRETVCKHECRRSCRGIFFFFFFFCKARGLFGDWFPLPLFQFVVPAPALDGELSQTGSLFSPTSQSSHKLFGNTNSLPSQCG